MLILLIPVRNLLRFLMIKSIYNEALLRSFRLWLPCPTVQLGIFCVGVRLWCILLGFLLYFALIAVAFLLCFYGNLNACQIAFHAHACIYIYAFLFFPPVFPSAPFALWPAPTNDFGCCSYSRCISSARANLVEYQRRTQERDGNRKINRRANHNQKGYMANCQLEDWG